MLKKSMFNFISGYNDETMLYNSAVGSASFIKIDSKYSDELHRCLNDPTNYENNSLKNELIKFGYLVDSDLDEILLSDILLFKRVFSPILSLVILPTEDCNFRCSYCYEEFNNGKMSKETVDSIILYVSKNLHNYIGLHVSWFGGEPLYASDIIFYLSEELLKICKTAKKPYSADMITNGYYLNADVCRKLIDYKVYDIQITIDGLKTQHDTQRYLETHSGSYDVILNNLIEIKDKINFKYINFVIRTNFTTKMFDSIEDHYMDLVDIFGNDKRFSFFFRPVGNWGGDKVKNITDIIYNDETFKKVYQKIIKLSLNMNFSRYKSFYDNATCPSCYINSFIVGSNGDLYKCSCHINRENHIGSLTKEGVMNVDLKREMMWFNWSVKQKRCMKCYLKAVCNNMACPKPEHLSVESDDYSEDCPYEKKYIKETLILLNMNGFFKKINV